MKSVQTKTKNLKVLSKAVAWLVILVLIAGCSGKAGDGASQNANQENTQSTENTVESSQSAAAPVSAGGAWSELWKKPAPGEFNDVALGPMEETVTLKVVKAYGVSGEVNEGVTPENSMWNDIIREQLNIEFDYMWVVTSDQWDQRFQLSISAGDIPDLLEMNERRFRTFVETGSLRDMTEAYDKYALPELKNMDAAVNGATIRQATVDGKLMGIPRYEDNHASVNVLWYRGDWARKLDIGAPQTIDELVDMAVKFGNQPDMPEATGIAVQNNVIGETYSLGSLFQCYGAYPNKWIVKDGQVVPGIIQDEMLQAMNVARSLYTQGAIPKDFAALDWNLICEKIINSTVGIAFGRWWAPDSPLASSIEYDPEAEWVLAPMPGRSAGVPAISTVEENMVHFYNGVYKDAPKEAEEAMVKLINFYFVNTFAATNDSWPQEPLATTEEEYQAVLKRGVDRIALGMVWNWSPVLTWNATENSDSARIANQAFNARDISLLRNANDKDLYDKAVLWQDKGVNDADFKNNWRVYASRVMDDNGVLLTARLRDEGYVINNVFYGGATETEEQVRSTLEDMATEYFAKYVMGEVGAESWEGFVNDWLSNGGQDWWDEVVEGYNAIH